MSYRHFQLVLRNSIRTTSVLMGCASAAVACDADCRTPLLWGCGPGLLSERMAPESVRKREISLAARAESDTGIVLALIGFKIEARLPYAAATGAAPVGVAGCWLKDAPPHKASTKVAGASQNNP